MPAGHPTPGDYAAVHYYHPTGSCKMGPASGPYSVVDSEGRR
jgi:choline dehydrogenase-like flavoprotein